MTADLERVDVVEGQVPLPGIPEPEPPVSADRRRTRRQRAAIAAGRHPLTGGNTRPELGTCGDCAHRTLMGWHDRTYPKCDLGPISHGSATDVRAWWPACGRHEPGDPRMGPDAARWTPDRTEEPT